MLRFNLTTECDGQKKVIASIQFDEDSRELFYHFMYSKHANKRLFSYLAQKKTGRPGHISWHRNRVHLKLHKDDPIMVREYDNLHSENPEHTTLLLVHSIYPISGEDLFLDLKNINASDKCVYRLLLSVTQKEPFSLILFIFPDHKAIDEVRKEICEALFYQDINLGEVVLQDNLCEDLKIGCYVTPKVLPYRNDAQVSPYFSGFVYLDVHKAIQQLFL